MVGSSRVWGHEARSKLVPPYTGGDPGFATLTPSAQVPATVGALGYSTVQAKAGPPGAYTPRRETMKNKNKIQCHPVVSAAKTQGVGRRGEMDEGQWGSTKMPDQSSNWSRSSETRKIKATITAKRSPRRTL